MKVLAIVPSLSKRTGGGRMSREIIERLLQKVEVTTLTEKGTVSTEEIEKFKAHPVLEPRASLAGFIRNCICARRLAQSTHIVHAFDAWPYGVYGYAAVIGTKRKLVINGIGTYSVAPLAHAKTAMLLRLAYKRAARILCISAYTKQKIDEKIQGLPTSIMHQGTTKLPTPSESTIQRIKSTLRIPDSAYPIIVTVGEIKERKGQFDTLKGIFLLRKEFPNALYIMAGSDTDLYVPEINTYATNNHLQIRITSNIKTDEELSALYSLADIFALNSNNHETHFEGFGLVILEAAQFGIPTIGSRDCGIEDAIQDGYSGILVGQMDHEGIAQAIKDILSDHENHKSNARSWYAKFSWDHTLSIILSVYDEIL